MTNTVLIKRSGTANSVPTAGQLLPGELAINYADGNLFYKNSSNVVTVIASNQFVSVAGNITSGNLNAAGLSLSGNVVSVIQSTSNIQTTGNISGNYFIGNGALLTGISGGGGGSDIANGTSNVNVLNNGNVTVAVAGTSNVVVFAQPGQYVTGIISASGNITGDNLIQSGTRVYKWTTSETAPANPVPGDEWFIGSTGKLYQYWNDGTGNAWVDQSQSTSFASLAVSGTAAIAGNITGGNIIGNIYTNSIINTGANSTGNIGSASGYFNTVFAKATSAQYADLAETYSADAEYPYGTVVVFGGDKEITVSNISHDIRVAGVISKDPAHLMNSAATGLPVALTGRVQCQVRGPVRKGDILVNIDTGTAGPLDPALAAWGCVIGKSLEDYSGDGVAMIEIAVGRF